LLVSRVSTSPGSLPRYAFCSVSSSDGSNSPDLTLVPCPACLDDRGEPTGETLVQLPSGTWVRQVCESCGGLKKVERDGKGMEPRSAGDDAAERNRPTTAPPPFDPAEFARESDAKIRAVAEASPSSLPTVRPPAGSDLVPASMNNLDTAGSIPDVQEVEPNSAHDALGPNAIPVLAVSHEDLAWFDLGPEAVRLLAFVNGISSLEAICAKANITAEEGAVLLLDLAEVGVVGFR